MLSQNIPGSGPPKIEVFGRETPKYVDVFDKLKWNGVKLLD